MKNRKEIVLSKKQCLDILRGKEVVDEKTNSIFILLKDYEGYLNMLDNGECREYYHREGIAHCLEKNSNTKYQLEYTEEGKYDNDLSCFPSPCLKQIKGK